jgi:hypothetical protein
MNIWLANLLLDPKFAGSHPAEDDGFLRSMKIRITTSIRGEVKLSVTCRKILRRVKEPYEYERDFIGKIQLLFTAKFRLLRY